MRNEPVVLVTVYGEIRDSDGYLVEERTHLVDVLAEKKSVGRTEFYAALRNNIKVNAVFSVDPGDYELADYKIAIDNKEKKLRASKLIHDDVEYLIKRTYQIPGGDLELICEEVE